MGLRETSLILKRGALDAGPGASNVCSSFAAAKRNGAKATARKLQGCRGCRLFCRAHPHVHIGTNVYIYIYPPTPAGAAPRSSVHVCSPLSTTRPLPFLQIAIGPRLPHPFYCSGISPPPPGTRRSHSAVLGTTSSALLGTPRHHKPSSVAPPCLF